MSPRPQTAVQQKPSAEKCSDPLEILVNEHEKGELHLRNLRDAANDIRTHGFSTGAFNRIGEAIRFIDTEMRHHNEKEEEFLLPLIAPHIPDAPLEMRREHRALWTAFEELRRYVQDIEDGRLRGTAITDLVESALLIVYILGDHIVRENEVLFPAVKRLLSPDEYDQLTKGIAGSANRAG